MGAKHTPGPWTIRDGSFIDGPGFTCLANVRAAHVPSEFEAIANARLIVAAPDMLAELKADEDMLLGAIPHAPRIRDLLIARLAAVRTAIGKAEERA